MARKRSVALAHRRLGALAVAQGAAQRLADVVDLAQAGRHRRLTSPLPMVRAAAAKSCAIERARSIRRRRRRPRGRAPRRTPGQAGPAAPRPHRLRDDPGRHLDRGSPAVGEWVNATKLPCIGERLQRRRSFGRRRDPLAQFGACQLVDETLRRHASSRSAAARSSRMGDPVGSQHIRAQDLAQVLGRQRAAQHQVTSADRIEHGDHITIADAAF